MSADLATTRAVPAPTALDARAAALRRVRMGDKYCIHFPFNRVSIDARKDWLNVAALVDSWLAYERQLSDDTIALKLRAERARALEEAALACELADDTTAATRKMYADASDCAKAIRALLIHT